MPLFEIPVKKSLFPKDDKLSKEESKIENNKNLTQYNQSFAYCKASNHKYIFIVYKDKFKLFDRYAISQCEDNNLLELHSIFNAIEIFSILKTKHIIVYTEYWDFDLMKDNDINSNNNYKQQIKKIIDLLDNFDSVKFVKNCPYQDIIELANNIINMKEK